jgi:hypothetical protein
MSSKSRSKNINSLTASKKESFVEPVSKEENNETIIQEENNSNEEVILIQDEKEITQNLDKEEDIKIKPTKEGFKPVFKIELELSSYSEAMDKSKAINPEEGGKWQYSLFTTIRNTLSNKSQEEFNKEWNTLLLFFNKNKEGIFNEHFIFRFPEQWPGSSNEFSIFRRILFTIIQTADPKNRKKNLSEINLELVTTGLTEVQRNNILNFYG